MAITQHDKIMLGCTGAIILSAVTMYGMVSQIEEKTKKLEVAIISMDKTLQQTREEVIVKNRSIEKGNELLKQLIKQDLIEIGRDAKKGNAKHG